MRLRIKPPIRGPGSRSLTVRAPSGPAGFVRPPPRLWRRPILRVLAAGAVLAGSAGPFGGLAAQAARVTEGGVGLRLLEAPVSSRDDPRAQLYIVDHLKPGGVIRRRIEVSNGTPSSQRIGLYAGAASIVDGSFLGAAGHTANDLSSWTSVRPAARAIPAGGRLTATVTITVPADAPPGEQYAAVWAEASSAAGAGVTQISRVGIRMYVSVGPGGAPAADFTIDSLTAGRTADQRPTVTASVHNTGGRALDMTGTLQLLGGPGGLSAGPFPASLGTTLAIKDTRPVTVVLDKQIPDGPWDATIKLRSGLRERSAQASLTFPRAGQSAAPTAAAAVPVRAEPPPSGRPGWVYPAAIGGTATVVAVAAGASKLVLLRRRLI
jgi:hypothetical protein